jgi:hypothetical protein
MSETAVRSPEGDEVLDLTDRAIQQMNGRPESDRLSPGLETSYVRQQPGCLDQRIRAHDLLEVGPSRRIDPCGRARPTTYGEAWQGPGRALFEIGHGRRQPVPSSART